MEIDFLGLNKKDSAKKVEDKSKNVCIDSAARVQWPHSYSIIASSPPLFMPLEATKQGKSGYDPIISSALNLPISTGYAFGTNSKPPCLPKNNTWTVPISDKTASASSSNFSINNETGATTASIDMDMQQTLGGISVAKPPSTFTNDGLIDKGKTTLRNNANFLGLPGQMTIFYADAMHVFHDISPKAAEAIMVIAGNESKNLSKPVTEDIQSNLQLEPPEHTTVPQARKATLARFLERRKNRLMNMRPYKQSVDCTLYSSPNEMNTSFFFIQPPDTGSS